MTATARPWAIRNGRRSSRLRRIRSTRLATTAFRRAYMHAAMAFFGTDRMDFSVVRIAGQPDVTRDYKHFTAVVDDTIDARVYQGLHFREAEVQGAGIGEGVARWLDRHFFQRAK